MPSCSTSILPSDFLDSSSSINEISYTSLMEPCKETMPENTNILQRNKTVETIDR